MSDADNSVKHIVITGASGFLGKHLLHSFLTAPPLLFPSSSSNDDQNQETSSSTQPPQRIVIHALYSSHADFDQRVQEHVAKYNNKNNSNIQVDIQTHAVDLSRADSFEKLPPMVDICLHTAALANPNACQNDPARARAINVPQHFFQAMLEKHCRLLVALSTDHVYPGTAPPYHASKNNHQEQEPVNVYGQTKLEMERYLMDSVNNNSLSCKIICLRSSIILGPKAPLAPDQSHATFLHFCASRDGQPTTFWTDEKRNVVAVSDVVQIITWLVEHYDDDNVVSNVYNMGGPDPVSRLDMARAVFRHFGYEAEGVLQGASKAAQAPNPQAAPSPLDISMASTPLQQLTQLKFATLPEMIAQTFADGGAK